VIGARIGAGREAEVYAWGDDAVVKLFRPGYEGHRTEAAALAALDGHGIAPRLHDVVEHDGRTGLVLERLDGRDLLIRLQRHPAGVRGWARTLAEAHRAVHAVAAPAGLPDLRPVLATRIDRAALPPRLRAFAHQVLAPLPDGDRLLHGDFHPGNVLVAEDRVSVIDWVGAARGVPEADHARTLLLLRWSDLPPGTPAVVRALLRLGRSLLAHEYARAYGRGSNRPSSPVDAWLTVHTAARLAEGIEAERPRLIRALERARLRAQQRAGATGLSTG
jgi:aminoglycoside phosphotransferase (APT) family kinase protein